MPPGVHIDPSQVDCSRVVAGREEIRRINPQRFEMEQLDAVVFLDAVNKIIVGYKDVRFDEFWVRGHLPLERSIAVSTECFQKLCQNTSE